jgi:hypothetical protein
MPTLTARSSCRLALLLAAAALALAIEPIRAEDAPYIGTWALDIATCKTPQDSQDAPLVIAKDHYDQHEVHCSFKSVTPEDSDYKISGDCMVEGNPQAYDFTLTVSGDTLTFTDEAGARDFLRCK